MLTEDYLMRIIRIGVAALAKVIGLKAALLYTDALYILDQALSDVTGLTPDLFNQMDDQSLLAFLSGPEGPDFERLAITADLLCEYGDINRSIDQPGNARTAEIRALFLYLEAALLPDLKPDQAEKAAAKIISMVQNYPLAELPANIQYSLFCFYESRGSYDLAEQALLSLKDTNGSSPEMDGEITDFYQRLLDKTDAELEQGKLARAQIRARLDP